MLTSQTLIEQLNTQPETVAFQDVIAVIDNEYTFTPTAFTNGEQKNGANENNGSCKILSFAKLNQLSSESTLHLFGDFYRKDVLEHPTATDHQNIRQFILNGWNGVAFEGQALTVK